MKKEIRTICYDDELNLELYRFEGIVQSFPNHFHDYYVIGYVESGTRRLFCKNNQYIIKSGDILLLNPNDNHGCTQSGEDALDYIGINIPVDTMLSLSEEITGKNTLLGFSQNVIKDSTLRVFLQFLHQMILSDGEMFEKEEMLFILISILLEKYGQPFENCIPECRDEIEIACCFMEEHYAEHISLEQLCKCSTLSKSTLLRAFTRSKGVTPYRYLQSVRVGKAKALLEKGINPIDVALQTGFADQSHFTNFFNMYIGLPPAAYKRMFKATHKESDYKIEKRENK